MTPQQSSSFYPPMNDISGNSDLLKDKPAYAWDAQTIDTKPKVQYDIQSEVEEKSRKTSPLVFIGATVLASGVAYTLMRNL